LELNILKFRMVVRSLKYYFLIGKIVLGDTKRIKLIIMFSVQLIQNWNNKYFLLKEFVIKL